MRWEDITVRFVIDSFPDCQLAAYFPQLFFLGLVDLNKVVKEGHHHAEFDAVSKVHDEVIELSLDFLFFLVDFIAFFLNFGGLGSG